MSEGGGSGRGGYRRWEREPDAGRDEYDRLGNIDYGGYPEAALGHGHGEPAPGRYRRSERHLGYGHGGRIDYGGYPRGVLGPGRGGAPRRGGGYGFGGDLEGVGEYRGRGPLGYTRSDERIREDVCDRLTDDPSLDASGIEVRVGSGEVTLSGTVGSRMDKRRAEDIAEEVSGVRHVQNDLRVRQGDPER